MKAAILLGLIVVGVEAHAVEAPLSEIERAEVLALTEAPSFVPECEKYIHIGGGFFSIFDTQTGVLSSSTGDGTIRFSLEKLRWESTYVYLPEGPCRVRLPGADQIELNMDRLDYIEDHRTGRPLYRLVASGAGIRIALIADSADPAAP